MSCHLLKCIFQRKIAGFKGLFHGSIRFYCLGIRSMYGFNIDESVDSGKVFKDPRSHAADHRRAELVSGGKLFDVGQVPKSVWRYVQ